MYLPRARIEYWLDFTAWKQQNQPWLAQAKRVQKRGSQDWREDKGNEPGEATGRGVLSGHTQGQFMEGKPRWAEAGQQNPIFKKMFIYLFTYLFIWLCCALVAACGM